MEKTVSCTCPVCNKRHEATPDIAAKFGIVSLCSACIDAAHVRFMKTTGKRLKLTCLPNCVCQR